MKQNTQQYRMALLMSEVECARKRDQEFFAGSDAHNEQSLETARVDANKPSPPTVTGDLANAHMPRPMILAGRDYVTQRLNGKRCHHKLIYVCEICQSEKRYFANLMPRNKEPICTGFSQYLAVNAQQTDTP